MESNLIKVPFEVELAKRISNGNEEGRIVTRGGDEARIVCWDYKSMSGDYPILALINRGKQELSIPYSKEGRYNVYGYFSEDCFDLMLEIPEYTTFKDGDILYVGTENNNNFIFINKNGASKTYKYVSLMNGVKLSFEHSECCYCERIKILRFATESEKQKLIEALKASKDPKAKEYLKRFLNIELKPKYKFKPYDKVLVRESNDFPWRIDLFSHIQDGAKPYVCLYLYWKYCIPYNDQTAHLLGTNKNWED